MDRIRLVPRIAAATIALLTLGTAPGWARHVSGDLATARVPARVATAFSAAASRTCWLEFGHTCVVSDLERLPVVDDIVRYRFRVRVGPGPFDVIRMHRVVRERRPFVPARTKDALFVLHAGSTGFEASFLPNLTTGLTPRTHAMPVFMARNGVDVWGMDLGWILVPADVTEFPFFADWGFDKEVSQTRAGLGIARALRAATSGDVGRMDFLGWSYGAQVGYVLVAEETQLPSWRRHVKGFIPVDMAMKYEPGALPDWVCGAAAYYQQVQDSGQYGDGSASFYSYVAALAINDPLGESPVSPPLNNQQAALLVGAGAGGFTPTFHMVAGTFDEQGTPTGLEFTQPDLFIHGLAGVSPYSPVLTFVDQFNTWCDQTDVPFDDHLGDVKVPTLYLGAAGGFGQAGVYSTTLLGSEDVTIRIVTLRPAGEEALDIGHWDLWIADNAAKVAWRPILDWLKKH